MKRNQTSDTSKQWRNAIIAAVLASILLAAAWYVIGTNAEQKNHAMAKTMAKMLAQQAADQLLADDMLALQNIIRRTAQLPNVHYAGVYDAAGTPISEAGTVVGIANTFTASATVFTEATQMGIASISVETPTDKHLLALLLLPILAGLLGFLLPSAKASITTIKPTTDFRSLEPLLYLSVHAQLNDYSDGGAATKLDQAATLIAKLYGAQVERILGGYLLRFDDKKDPTTRACCVARLWYASFAHYKNLAGFDFGAAALLTAYPSLTGNQLQQDYGHNRWLLDMQSLVESQQGVMLSYEFMALQDVAQSVVVQDGADYFRLKSLKPTLDKLVRKQLRQIVKTLSAK